MAEARRYAAFISYSHKDERFVRRLHRALESYVIPKALGAFALAGESGKPNRVSPIFRDRDELAAGELDEQIKARLSASENLIVVCSPDSARSPWVTQEIEFFAALGKRDRIFAIIAATAPPEAAGTDTIAANFPPALGTTPLAGDARRSGDGFRKAWLKLVAGVAGLDFGRVVDRDLAARQRRFVQAAGVGVVLAAVLGVLSTAWLLESTHARNAANERLLAEMRQAFEAEDYPRAVAILADQAQLPGGDVYTAALAAWAPRYASYVEAIQSAPPVFRFSGRYYLKSPEGLRALPFTGRQVPVASKDGAIVFSIDSAGRIWQAGPEDAEAHAAEIQDKAFAEYTWRQAAVLNSGTLVFYGAAQSAQLSGEAPSFAFINSANKSFVILSDDHGDGVRISGDCTIVEWLFDPFEGDAPPTTMFQTSIEGDRYRFGLSAADKGVERIAAKTVGPSMKTVASLEQLVDACGDRQAFTPENDEESGMGAQAGGVAYPVVAQSPDDWKEEEAEDQSAKDAALRASYVAMREALQRSKFAHPPPDLELNDANAVFRDYPGVAFAADGESRLTLLATGWDGGKYGRVAVCLSASAETVDCNTVQYLGDSGAYRDFGRFIYVQDFFYMGHPLFALVDRRDAHVVKFEAPDFQNLAGPIPAGVALSPSGRRLAMPLDGQIVLIDLADDLTPTLRKRFEAPVLAGAGKSEFGQSQVALAFADEDKLVGVTDGGLAFGMDVDRERDLWQFRINTGKRLAPSIAIANGRIGVRGGDYLAVLDLATGLPLAPVRRGRDGEDAGDQKITAAGGDEVLADEPAPSNDETCGPARDETCASIDELRAMAREVELPRETEIVAAEDGAFIARFGGARIVYASEAAPDAVVAAEIPCRTGWMVTGERVVRLDPLSWIRAADGVNVPLESLAICDVRRYR